MEDKSSQKKAIFFSVIVLLTLVVMIIGASMAYMTLIASQKEDATQLYTGTLEISYIDGTYIKNPTLFPLSTVNYNTKDNVYRNTFAVRSTGTLDQLISIDLEITNNEFLDNALKYVVYNVAGTEMDSGYVPHSGKINLASNIFLEHGKSAEYTIIVWWDNTNYDQSVDSNHTITGKIVAYAKQVKY